MSEQRRHSNRPTSVTTVGIFDSGLGGLTVASALLRQAPHVSLIYLADNARVPYGGRTVEEVGRFAAEIIEWLVGQGADLIMAGCNMSSVAIEDLSVGRDCPVPIITTVGPGAKTAIEATRNGRIGVLATEGTVASHAYGRRLSASDRVRHVEEVACPDWVPLIESLETNSPRVREPVERRLAPLREALVDTVILGCTHYPILAPSIAQTLGPGVTLIDPAKAMAERALSIISLDGAPAPPSRRFFATGSGDNLVRLGAKILGSPIRQVEIVQIPDARCQMPDACGFGIRNSELGIQGRRAVAPKPETRNPDSDV